VHPLLHRDATTDDGVVHVRRFPSETYRTDNQRIEQYLPARCVVPADVVDGDGRISLAGTGDGERLDALLASVAVMALPPPAPPAPPPGR